MNLLVGILLCLQFSTGEDTLRKDGYYVTVSEGSAHWKIEYFRPDGYFTDSLGQGTPPVLEKEMLETKTSIGYSVTKGKEGFTIRYEDLDPLPYHISSFPMELKCEIENGELVVLAIRDNLKKRWRKVKIRYYFIPF